MIELSQRIEHTLLKPDTTIEGVKKLCDEVIRYNLGGVCIPPLYVRGARQVLGEETPARVVTVVGFPMGYSPIVAKSEEIKRATDDGVDEVDGMINIAALKSGQWSHVQNDIDSMLRAAQMKGRVLKLILECGMLNDEELKRACDIVIELDVPFVKTGTGYHGFDATADMVHKLRKLLPGSVRIKAAGGIRTRQRAEELIDAGADRLGTSDALGLLGIKDK